MEESAVTSRSLPEAVRWKYLDDNNDEGDLDSIVIPQTRREAYSRLHSSLGQQFLTLDSLNITHAGPEGEIRELCPNVVELDLTGNNLKEWKEVFRMITQLPHLAFLNLSCNPLEPHLTKEHIEPIVGNSTFPGIKRLILNSTFTPMRTVFDVLKIIPSEELHLSLNSYDEFPPSEEMFPSVKSLHIAGNGLQRRRCLHNLGDAFPLLTSLIFCQNPIEELPVNDIDKLFTNLRTLSLSRTKIRNWDQVDALRRLPALEDVRVDGIPLLDDYSVEEARQFLISRLPGVTKLNRSSVNSEERENAERKFIRHYLEHDDKPSRYDELVAVHGQLQRLVDIDIGQGLKSAATVTLECEGKKPLLRKINLKQSTGNFKREVCKLLHLRLSDVRLYYCDQEVVGALGPEDMNYPTRSLLRYDISDGDVIRVVVKPPSRRVCARMAKGSPRK